MWIMRKKVFLHKQTRKTVNRIISIREKGLIQLQLITCFICIHCAVEQGTSKGENEIPRRRKLHFENAIIRSLVRESISEPGTRT